MTARSRKCRRPAMIAPCSGPADRLFFAAISRFLQSGKPLTRARGFTFGI